MVLQEKKIPHTIAEEDLSDPSPELLKLHPEGKVPVLIHGQVVLSESAIITEYLEDAFPEALALRPTQPAEIARMRLWTVWCDQTLKPDLDLFKYEWDSLPPIHQVALTERIKGHLEKLAASLTTQPYLLGTELTLADIHVFPFYRQLIRSRPIEDRPQATDPWLQKITERPSYERVMRKSSK
jgi:glutathione S-transferase